VTDVPDLALLNGLDFSPSSILSHARQEYVDLLKHINTAIVDRPLNVSMTINGLTFEAMVPTNNDLIFGNPELCVALNA